MDHFTVRPTGWQIAKRAWASLRDGFAAMPLLFISAMVLGAALSVACFAVPHLTSLLLAGKKALTPPMIWPALGARFAQAVLRTIVVAPVAVAMHRFILLDQVTRGPILWSRRTLVFTGWLIFVQFVFLLPTATRLLMAENAPEGMLVFCAGIAIWLLSLYLVALFPAVAIAAPTPSLSMRLETSIAQTIGHYLLLVWAGILTVVPLIVLAAVLGFPLAALTKAAQTALVTARPHPPVLVSAALLGALNVLIVAQIAAVASWFYSWVSRASSSVASG